jgi:hypothetical protein
MSNRHQRRADLADFKREAHKAHLDTFLIDAEALDDHPTFARAVSFWRDNVQQRRPFCMMCRSGFADDAVADAFLLAMPSAAPSSISVTAICSTCWRDLPDDVIEREATKVLRGLLPRGHFIDAGRR